MTNDALIARQDLAPSGSLDLGLENPLKQLARARRDRIAHDLIPELRDGYIGNVPRRKNYA